MSDQQQPGPDEMAEFLQRMLRESAANPQVAAMLKAMGVDPDDPATLQRLSGELNQLFASGAMPPGLFPGMPTVTPGMGFRAPATAPDAAALANDVARKQVLASDSNDLVDEAQRQAVTEAVRVAALWLDPVTTFDIAADDRAWSRAEWVDATMPIWQRAVAPVADGVAAAIEATMRKQFGQLGELSEHVDLSDPSATGLPFALPKDFDPTALVSQMAPMVQLMSRQMFALQTGSAVGTLAAAVVSGSEVGLPLTTDGVVAILPGAVTALADGLELDRAEVLLYCAVRESVRASLLAGAPWLGPHILTAVEDYARHISIDTERIETALRDVDVSNPEALQEALSDSLFRPHPTSEQVAALARLETYLALAEGWVDVVTAAATRERLPHADALAEDVRRRRVGGTASKTFASLVGLELRPRRLRDAANLWAALEDAGGATLRDSAWAHPDVAPTAADLDDPMGFVERLRGGSVAASSDGGLDELDAALAQILGEADEQRKREHDEGPGRGPGDSTGAGGSPSDPSA